MLSAGLATDVAALTALGAAATGAAALAADAMVGRVAAEMTVKATADANFWDEEKGVPTSRLMNGTELREWTALGHEIGAHTIDHADLTCLEQERARAQVRGSRKLLENIIGDEVLAFCYPYGRYRLEHVDMVREAGFTSAVTTDPGHVRLSSDRHSLPRISVARSTSFLMLARKMFVR